MTIPVPTRPGHDASWIESLPSDGPTVRSSRILTGAGSAPARSTIARSLAVLMSKLPPVMGGVARRDLVADHGRGLHHAVEHDGKLALHFAAVTRAKSERPRGSSSCSRPMRPGSSARRPTCASALATEPPVHLGFPLEHVQLAAGHALHADVAVAPQQLRVERQDRVHRAPASSFSTAATSSLRKKPWSSMRPVIGCRRAACPCWVSPWVEVAVEPARTMPWPPRDCARSLNSSRAVWPISSIARARSVRPGS